MARYVLTGIRIWLYHCFGKSLNGGVISIMIYSFLFQKLYPSCYCISRVLRFLSKCSYKALDHIHHFIGAWCFICSASDMIMFLMFGFTAC